MSVTALPSTPDPSAAGPAPGADPAAGYFSHSGEFRDAVLETAFRATILDEIRDMARISGYVITILFMLSLARDYWLLAGEAAFYSVAALRLFGLGVSGIYLFAVQRAETTTRLFAVITFGEFMLSLQFLLQWLIAPQGLVLPAVVTLAAVYGYYLVISTGGLAAVFNAGGLSIAYLFCAAYSFEQSLDEIYILGLLLLAVNLLGFFGMRKAREMRRRNFLAQSMAARAHAERDAARAETLRREAYQAWALDALPMGVALFDPHGHLHTANRRAIELMAVNPKLAEPGTSLDSLLRRLAARGDFGQHGVDDFRQHMDRLASGEVNVLSARHKPTGRILDFTLGRLPDGSLALTIADATERVAAERRLRHAVEAAGDGFAIYDAQDRLVICSSRYAGLYGLTAEDAQGKHFDELLAVGYERGVFDPAERQPGAQSHMLDRSEMQERSLDVRTLQGEWYLVQERVTAGGDLVVLRSNITERHHIEDELRRAKTEAERMLADLRQAQSNLILAEKMASLGSLVANMSHEISTPLGIGVTAASHLGEELNQLGEILRDDQKPLDRAWLEDFQSAAAEAARILQSNLARAARLMRALKQVSADQASDEPRLFEVGPYLHEVLVSLAPALRRTPHRVEIDCPEGLSIEHRPGAFSQIVTNLVMNALQHGYTDRDKPGLIRVRVAPIRADRMELEVSDDGRGIPEAVRPRVFDPFFTTKRGTGGTGLGLHIVYTLVTQSLGGSISVQSRPGNGSVFSILFPVRAPDDRPLKDKTVRAA
ncbi:PAS-domain containing protein [Ferrovibrio sp.]|uniref:PAS-domain containing protein n=1 Tax=Ferrovibrio sp. TaxID=1917215 RepID=UPI0035B3B91F